MQSTWSAVVALALIPVYIKFLGLHSYGIIGLYGSILATLLFFDFGITATISRKAAILSQQKSYVELGRLCTSLSIAIWLITLALSAIGLLSSRWLAENWIKASSELATTLPSALTWMFLAVAARLPTNFYHGILIGIGRLNVSSSLQILYVTLNGLATVVCLVLWEADLRNFFQIQFLLNLLHLAAVRIAVSRCQRFASLRDATFSAIRDVIRFSLTMTLVSGSGLIFMHSDKFLLSSMVAADRLGAYSAASLLSMSIFILIGPTYNVLYPKFSRLVAAGRVDEATEIYFAATCLIFAAIFPIATVLSVHSYFVLHTWTANPDLASKAAPALSVLCLGFLANGTMYPAYTLQLAHGRANLALGINATLLLLYMPVAYMLIGQFGEIGAAWSWFSVCVIYMFAGTYITLKVLKLRVDYSAVMMKLLLPFLVLNALIFLVCTLVLTENLGMQWVVMTFLVGVCLSITYLFLVKETRRYVLEWRHALYINWMKQWRRNI